MWDVGCGDVGKWWWERKGGFGRMREIDGEEK